MGMCSLQVRFLRSCTTPALSDGWISPTLLVRRCEGLANASIHDVVTHDVVLEDLVGDVDDDGARAAPGSIFPVNERWAVTWRSVEADGETLRRVREDLVDWRPPSLDHDLPALREDAAGYLKHWTPRRQA